MRLATTTIDNKPQRQEQHLSDIALIAIYREAALRYGPQSYEAGQAFEPIYKRYWPMALQMAGQHLSALYAEDLAAETMLTVLKRLNGKENITNFRGLFYHSFNCRCSDMTEKLYKGKKNARMLGADAPVAIYPLSLNQPHHITNNVGMGEEFDLMNALIDERSDSEVSNAASRRELVLKLRELISEMPIQYRRPLIGQWLQGKPIREVAQELGVTTDVVKHNTARGIKWLKAHLPGEAHDWLLAA